MELNRGVRVICGLFGAISTSLYNGELDNVVELGIVSQLRGKDSTGVAIGRKNKGIIDVDVLKTVDNASNFFESSEVCRALYHDKPFVVIGHCRAATKGLVNFDNAHPFEVGPIVGVHNGTIPGIRGQEKDGTDSEALYRIMKDEGLQAAVDAARHGAYALVWTDSRDQSINFLRNTGRTLYLCEHNGTLYWCSDAYMLRLIMARAQVAKPDIYALKEDTHVKRSLIAPLGKMETREMKPTPLEGFMSRFGTKWVHKDEEKKTEIKVTHTVMGPSVPVVPPALPQKNAPYQAVKIMVKGFNNHLMSVDKARKLLANGCAHCGKVKSINLDKFYMYNKKCYVCEDCHNDTKAIEFLGIKKTFEGQLITVGGHSKHAH